MAPTSTPQATILLSEPVLGKRLRDKPLVLLLSSSPELTSKPAGPDLDSPTKGQQDGPPIIINGVLVPNTKHRYQCTYSQCLKSYSKPSRLAEHERSHTGQRPFVCTTCNKSYLRETHLHAHARSHLPDSNRPLLCPKDNCEKRFWTHQHLRVHTAWHDGAKSFQCSEAGCTEAFTKHHQLRAHVCAAHAPSGTKPYPCSHNGCDKSFSTNQHLRTHVKVHDEHRYTCVHAACLPESDGSPTYYPTWTALQHHIRTAHPPTCTHIACAGRVFTSQKGFRAHQKLHEQRELQHELENCDMSGSEEYNGPRKRRRGGEIGRDWKCTADGCDGEFKSKKALETHNNVTHLGRRDYKCSYRDCEKAYGYKHLLQRHLATAHRTVLDNKKASGCQKSSDHVTGTRTSTQAHALDIDTITGQTYAQRAYVKLTDATGLPCPYPIVGIEAEGTAQALDASTSNGCSYVFSRAYDLRRHLKAAHHLDISKEAVDSWVRKQKNL